jgi:hypothetical protein
MFMRYSLQILHAIGGSACTTEFNVTFKNTKVLLYIEETAVFIYQLCINYATYSQKLFFLYFHIYVSYRKICN